MKDAKVLTREERTAGLTVVTDPCRKERLEPPREPVAPRGGARRPGQSI